MNLEYRTDKNDAVPYLTLHKHYAGSLCEEK